MSHKIFHLCFVLVLIIGLLTITAPQPVHAAGPWYVATTGNDNNDCLSPASPCATINGAIGKASGGDTVNVAEGMYTGSGNEVVLIDRDITLLGGWDASFTTQSGVSTIDGEGVRRGVTVNSSITATLERFVAQNGNSGIVEGGGIGNFSGTLTLNYSTVSGNTASNGGGISNFSGRLTLNNSTVIGNAAPNGFGGGIFNFGTLTLNNSTVSGNTGGTGGGIYTGGIFGAGTMTLNNSTVSGNTAPNGPGGGNFGGGIYIDSGTLMLNNSTISSNSAVTGGGIYPNSGTVTLKNTLLAGNSAAGDGPDCWGSIGSGGHNLIGNTTNCNFTQPSEDLLNADPLLGPLQDNGGPTFTHALLPGSPALDAGNPTGCTDQDGILLTTDQRGVTRPQGTRCDIGAFELEGGGSTPGGPWYVAATGNDNNDCLSPTTPCATIAGGLGKASSGDTVYVAEGTYTGSGNEVILIDKNITISGGWDASFVTQTGMSIMNGETARRGVTISSGTVTSLDHLTIQNGNKTGGGGGIFNDGTLMLTNTLIADNIWGVGEGGGIFNTPIGVITLNNTTITRNGNRDLCNGTAIWNQGTITANNSSITENRVTDIFCGIGSAVINFTGADYRGTIILNNTTVSNNSPGGGIYNYGNLTLTNSTISNNVGDDSNGPGGIYNSLDGILILNSSTVTGNMSSGSGGGIFNIGFGNGTVTLQNSIVAGNTSSHGADCTGTVGSLGYNLIGDTTNCNFVAGTGDLTNVDAKLGSLIGSPGYRPSPRTSPAVDAGNPAGCTDQNGNLLTTDRGVARVGICDIGAYEYTAPGSVTNLFILSGDAQRSITTLPFAKPFQVGAVDSQGSPVGEVTIDFTAPDSGPSGTFANTGTNTTSATTDASGVATTSVFTANDQAGSYIVSASTTGAGSVNFNLEQVDRPANDNFANAEVIASLPFNNSVDVTNATKEPGEPSNCGNGPNGQSLWYSFTPATNMVISADTAVVVSSLLISRFSNQQDPASKGLAVVRNGCFGQSLTFNAQAGTTYYIQAEWGSSGAGNLQLNLQAIPAPANDNFADAELIGALPFSATVDNTGATLEPDGAPGVRFCVSERLVCFYPIRKYGSPIGYGMEVLSEGSRAYFSPQDRGISDLTLLRCVFILPIYRSKEGKLTTCE